MASALNSGGYGSLVLGMWTPFWVTIVPQSQGVHRTNSTPRLKLVCGLVVGLDRRAVRRPEGPDRLHEAVRALRLAGAAVPARTALATSSASMASDLPSPR